MLINPKIALVGIFVGGKSSRMGGQPKGLLPAFDTKEPLVVRSARLAHELGLEAVLVGESEPYRALVPNLRVVEDQPKNIGPLGGLAGLLHAAQNGHALAIACDMPHLSTQLLTRIATEQPSAQLLAPRNKQGFWEPLCARYDAARVLPILEQGLQQNIRSFQKLFAHLMPTEIELSEQEYAQLTDWDTPEDVTRG